MDDPPRTPHLSRFLDFFRWHLFLGGMAAEVEEQLELNVRI